MRLVHCYAERAWVRTTRLVPQTHQHTAQVDHITAGCGTIRKRKAEERENVPPVRVQTSLHTFTSAAKLTMLTRTRSRTSAKMVSWILPGSHVVRLPNTTSTSRELDAGR